MKTYIEKAVALLLVLTLALSASGCISTYVLYRMLDVESAQSSEVPAKSAKPKRTAPLPEVTEKPKQSAAPSDAAEPAPELHAPADGVTFSEMEYVKPDTAEMEAQLQALIDDIADGEKPETWLTRYDEALLRYNDAESQLSLAYLLYSFDVTEDYYQDEYEMLEIALLELDVLLADAALAILESPEKGDEAVKTWDEGFVKNAYLSDQLNSYTVQDLLQEEVALELDYDELLTTYVYKEGNRTWTLEDLAPAFYAGEIDYDEYFRLYNAYCAGVNETAGALFLDLLSVRSEIAAELGYGSFAAYRYECYERDFTLEEAKTLHAAVKEYLVPLYFKLIVMGQTDTQALDALSFPLDGYWETLSGVAADFSPRLAESLQYMLDCELYDFAVDEKKMEGSFTTYLSNYHAPFIFTQWQESASDVRTVIHELGHFTNDYFNPSYGWCSGYSLDLAEVDSQGLELLMMEDYDAFFGDLADAAAAEMLTNAVYAIVSGCMEDEFQQYAYANPDVTLDELNAKYLELSEEYGLQDLYGYTGTEWALVPHSFQSPMYYISYATSMLLSLELWAKANTDPAAAKEIYWEIVDRGSYDKFRAVAMRSGLMDPMLPETVRALAHALDVALS